MKNYTITKNKEYNSIEIKFDGIPSEDTRATLKAHGFRWHRLKGVWYGYGDEKEIAELGYGGQVEQPTEAKTGRRTTATGFKVGDLFVATWGYDQTNNNFFQIVAIKGHNSVLIKEVEPRCIRERGIGFMSGNYTYETPKAGEMLPPVNYSIFIKNNETGDLKRICTNEYVPQGFIRINNHRAYPYNGRELYQSWYA